MQTPNSHRSGRGCLENTSKETGNYPLENLEWRVLYSHLEGMLRYDKICLVVFVKLSLRHGACLLSHSNSKQLRWYTNEQLVWLLSRRKWNIKVLYYKSLLSNTSLYQYDYLQMTENPNLTGLTKDVFWLTLKSPELSLSQVRLGLVAQCHQGPTFSLVCHYLLWYCLHSQAPHANIRKLQTPLTCPFNKKKKKVLP